MKFTLPTILALAYVGAADKLTTYTRCLDWCHSDGVWYTDYGGVFNIDANDGCRNWPGPTGLYKLCVDWNEKRLTADFEAPGGQHCLRKGDDYDCYQDDKYAVCADWNEVICDW